MELSSRKQQDIVKSRIEWINICDALERWPMPVVENNITGALWLITVTWKNNSNLIVGGIREIVAVMVTGFIELQSYFALLFWKHSAGELMGLPVHLNCRVAVVEHVLEYNQSGTIELGVPGIGHAKVDSICWIIDVQLSIYWRLPFG